MKTKNAIMRMAFTLALMTGMTVSAQEQTTTGWSSKQDSLSTWMLGIISDYADNPDISAADHRCWSEARQMNIHESYAIYGLLFPEGDSIETARNIMRGIENVEWQRAKKSNNWKVVYDFAGKYRYGYYFEEAMALSESLFSSYSEDINELFEEGGFCAAQDSGIVFISNIDNDGDKVTFTISDSKTGRTIVSRVLQPGQYKEIRLLNGDYNVVIGGTDVAEPKHGTMRVANKIYCLNYFVSPIIAKIIRPREELFEAYTDSTICAQHIAVLSRIVGMEYIKLLISEYKKSPSQNAYINGDMVIVEGQFPEELGGVSLASYTTQELKDYVRASFIDTFAPLATALVYCSKGISYTYTGDISGKTVTVSFSPLEMMLIAAEIDTKISETNQR